MQTVKEAVRRGHEDIKSNLKRKIKEKKEKRKHD